MTDKTETEKLQAIHKRLEEYKKHRNDPYSYYPEEIPAVQDLKSHAVEDIEFLLKELDKKL